MAIVKFAIVGLGNIGKRHAEHIMNHPNAHLVAYCDIDSAKSSLYELPFFTDYVQMLEHTDADVICVCTPNYLHEIHCVEALENAKHAVVEKPMALSVASCDRMIQTAEKTRRKIFVVKQNRYNAPVAAVKDLVSRNVLGETYMVQVNCFWNRGDAYYAAGDWRGKKEKDGGCLFTQFSHFVDILYYLNGPLSSVQGIVGNYAHLHNTEFEDTGSFVMKAQNGAIINFNFTTCAHERNMEGAITVFAEKGTVKIGGQYLNTIEYQQIEGYAIPAIHIAAKSNDYGLYQGSMSNHDQLIDNVVGVLLEGKTVTTTAEEGREVVRMIEQMYDAVSK